MPSYFPLRVSARPGQELLRGLNTRAREDQLMPGEASVATNVEFRNESVRKRRGFKNLLVGALDAVWKGGPPGDSIQVRGDEFSQLERGITVTSGEEVSMIREDPPHHRNGVIVFPEGGSPLRLDVKTGENDWLIEFCLWAPEFSSRADIPESVAAFWLPTVVMAKSNGTAGNWAVRIVTDAADLSGRPRFYLVLTLYEDEVRTAGTDFFYTDGGTERSWFDPGKRHWFAFKFVDDAVTPLVHSYYWQEGDSAAVTSSAAPSAGLTLNGTQAGSPLAHPIVIGKRPAPYPSVATASVQEQGFNGSLSEFRFYGAASSLSHPTFDSSYGYYESEYETSELQDTGGTWTGDNDVLLYLSLSDQYAGDTSDADANHIILPRYSAGTAGNNKAWLTGADAVWAPGTGALGEQCLNFIPGATQAGDEDAYFNAIGIQSSRGWYHTHGAGLRIPRGDKYVTADDTSGGSGGFLVNTGFSVRVAFRIRQLGGTADRHTLFALHKVIQGTAPDEHQYRTVPLVRLEVFHDGANWVLRGASRDLTLPSTETVQTVDSTTTIAENTVYVAVLTVQYHGPVGSGQDHEMRLYLDGIQEATTSSTPVEKPGMSEVTGTDTGADGNGNDDDGRDQCFPASIGCALWGGTDDRQFIFGAVEVVGDRGTPSGSANTLRRWWSYHNNDTRMTSDSGAGFRGLYPIRGDIGNVQIWGKTITEQEVAAFATAAPDDQQIAAYGADLLSSWDMEEGSGALIWDKGYLSNHIPLHPYPIAMPIPGPVSRVEKSRITGFWEVRTRTPREGVTGRDIFALAGGGVLAMRTDGSGDEYFRAISGPLIHYSKLLPTGFQSSDFFYLCTGEGPVMRISRGRVTIAGIARVFGDSDVRRGDNLGWVEADRNGTFEIVENTGTAGFTAGDKYGYLISHYDPETGTESGPSRQCFYTVEADSVSLEIFFLPKPREPQASRIRIYRTGADGGIFKFVAEIPVSDHGYIDTTTDAELGFQYTGTSFSPPPMGARLGVGFGARALYAGVPEFPSTIFPSLSGFPEICPPQYQLTVAKGRNNKITGLTSYMGRVLVWMQDTVFRVSDLGGDSSPSNLQGPPIVFEELRDGVGSVSHHATLVIDDIGIVFPGERGIYITNGADRWTYVSERIEPTWGTLDKSTYQQWHAVHNRKSDQYFLFCSDGTDTVDGITRNNTVIVWDYSRNAFSLYTGIYAAYSFVVEDPDNGENRIYFCDYLGQLWEFDSPDGAVDTDGGSPGSYTTTSGTLPDGTSTTTDLKLFASSTLPTAADGLRGVPITIGEGDSKQTKIILSNTGTNVTLETALSSAPAVRTVWRLGAIAAEWQSGKLDMGSKSRLKQVPWWQGEFEPQSGSRVTMTAQLDEDDQIEFDQEDAGQQYRRTPGLKGRCRRVKVGIKDEKPDNHWEMTDMEIAYQPRGRSSW